MTMRTRFAVGGLTGRCWGNSLLLLLLSSPTTSRPGSGSGCLLFSVSSLLVFQSSSSLLFSLAQNDFLFCLSTLVRYSLITSVYLSRRSLLLGHRHSDGTVSYYHYDSVANSSNASCAQRLLPKITYAWTGAGGCRYSPIPVHYV